MLIDERGASWKYLIPIDDRYRVLIVSNGQEYTPIALLRSFKHVTVMGERFEKVNSLQKWAKQENIVAVSIIVGSFRQFPFRSAQFDIVILSTDSIRITNGSFDFSSLSHILRPQGLVFCIGYSEDSRNNISFRKSLFMWEQHGWQVQQTYAFFPKYEGHKLVLPTRPSSVFQSGLRMHNTLTLQSKLKKSVVSLLGRLKILDCFLPGYLVVFARNGTNLKGWLLEYISKKVNEERFYIIVHNASPGRGAKAVLKVVGENGKALSYLKIADNRYRGKFIESESHNLEYLSRFSFKNASIPQAIAFDKINEHYLLVLNANEEKFGRSICSINEKIVDFLIELFISTSSLKLIHETVFWKETLHGLTVFEQNSIGKGHSWIKDLFFDVSLLIGEKRFPFGMVHRDFVGWNIRRQVNNDLFVMDWEWSKPDFIPFQDFFHFVLLTTWANSKKDVSSIIKESFDRKSGKHIDLLKRYCNGIDVSLEWSNCFLLLYLIEWTVFHLLNSTEMGEWAQESLLFLRSVRNKGTNAPERWLIG